MRQAAHNSGRLAATPLALLLLLVVAADISAAPLPTVGIGGALRLGFGGALRRAGIPFDYLTTAEQCDPDALRRYDLVLMADLMERYEPWRDDAMLALDSYVMGGGRLLCQPGARLPRAMAGWKIEERWPPGWPPVTEPRSFRL
ncbi:MAG: hypothetical protein HUU35_18315, partial [Armatimonadetes bacterium]|nr:hypothetical protein [Armatimonadota bacterium]